MASGRVPKTERTFKDGLFLSPLLSTPLACLAGISDFQYLLCGNRKTAHPREKETTISHSIRVINNGIGCTELAIRCVQPSNQMKTVKICHFTKLLADRTKPNINALSRSFPRPKPSQSITPSTMNTMRYEY